MIKSLQLVAVICAVLLFGAAGAAQPLVLQNDDITVVYEASLKRAADEILAVYPQLRQELAEFFGWDCDINPQVVLISKAPVFRQFAGNDFVVAFAVPAKNMIAIDHSKMNMRPFTLAITLKHELCHLILHHHIDSRNLPKWLDEGVSQWVSDGIGEIFVNKGWSGLDAAAMAGRIIPLRRLTDNFPRDRQSLTLAYEQSKSVVNFIDRQFGGHVILEVLNLLKNGETIDAAIRSSLGLSLEQLEEKWLDQLERTPRWLVFLASHIYGILFFVAAMLTMFGFMRHLRRRKKIYQKWEEEDDI